MTTMRLHRLHFNSIPCPRTLAINCPHSQRVSWFGVVSAADDFVEAIMPNPVNEIENDY